MTHPPLHSPDQDDDFIDDDDPVHGTDSLASRARTRRLERRPLPDLDAGDDDDEFDFAAEIHDEDDEGDGSDERDDADEDDVRDGYTLPRPHNDSPGFHRPPDAHEVDGLGALPVALTCEVGRLAVTVRDIRQFQAGQVIDLGRSVLDGAVLIVNGREIARGTLVDVEGRLGVMLTHVIEEPSHG